MVPENVPGPLLCGIDCRLELGRRRLCSVGIRFADCTSLDHRVENYRGALLCQLWIAERIEA
jgi:hypothetical protein